MQLMCPSNTDERGFSLVEALVSLALMVLILVGASQLLFSTKRSADRINLNSEARQTAQRALQYVAYHARTASDLNRQGRNPLAILTSYQISGAQIQASFNNVTDPNLADVGTDIITLALPNAGAPITCSRWVGGGSAGACNPNENHEDPIEAGNAANTYWSFSLGCPDGQRNIDLFKEMTGYDPDTGKSGPILLTGSDGSSTFYQITNYLESQNAGQSCQPDSCTGGFVIHVTNTPGQSDGLNPPTGPEDLRWPITMNAGVLYRSFRVHDGWLQQKDGMFNPNTDNPGNDFVSILPNIEDFQVAWVFNDGSIWNTAARQLNTGTYPFGVPTHGEVNPYDVINVVGLRMSVTAKSSTAAAWESSERFYRPAAEDHPVADTPDQFYHSKSTELAMIRNRNLQW